VEAAVAFEQLGAHLVPGPMTWTVLAAGLVDGAASGERIVAGIDAPSSPALVEHAIESDALLVLRADEVVVFDRAELPDIEVLTPLDPATPVGRVAIATGGTRVGDAADAARLRELGTVLTSALLLGIAARALDVARDYALEREQFGVPIGSFQAVKHMLADMYVRTGLARSATYAAAAVLDDRGSGDAPAQLATAKLLSGDAAMENAGDAVQVLGGMGFTWAMPPNFLLKRAHVLEHAFGTADDHALTLSAAVAQGA
jgi:alkylation response protein AidB-like acyl-CoA dehydrogenase